MEYRFIRFFKDICIDDIPLVGGKNASLGEMYRQLNAHGVRVPNGFAITAEAYRQLLDHNRLSEQLHDILGPLNHDDVEDLVRRGRRTREAIYGAELPDDLKEEIIAAYRELEHEYGAEMSVAVRSSATAEDLPTASFAGQQDSFLNIHGDQTLLDTCRRCFASLFTDRAIHYRVDKGFDHFKLALSIGVMKMVRSDLACSGVMFSLDTESGFRDAVFITGAYGLGENVVQGAVDPDEFYVHKPTFEQGYRCVLRRALGTKEIKMVYAKGDTRRTTVNVPTTDADRRRYCLTDDEVMTLADYAIKVERLYSEKAGQDRPMDMEWAKDGLDGELYMVQARPETVVSQKQGSLLEEYHLRGVGVEAATGHAVGSKIAAGPAHIINGTDQLNEFRRGEILVAGITTPDWEPIMKIAAAIVTERGGRTCHAAIVARELGIPAVIGVENARQLFGDGEPLTVSCAEGDTGRIYRGDIPYEKTTTDLSSLQRPKTHIMVNIGNPDLAFKTGFLPNDGVGLARMEFIINQYIKIHPMALLHPDRIEDPEDRATVLSMTEGYGNPGEFFVQRLAEGVGVIAAAFYPKPVIVRLSDFKSNEYASLIGGRAFEPREENPMLGFRGASRYTHPAYAEGFALECAAMKRVREVMGLANVKLMIPFCRRVGEGEAVLAKMAEFGLARGDNGLEVYVMCEIPNNVIQVDAFSRLFDGFSIGSNDLTQLTLGVDRDSPIVAFDFNERDEGVLEMIRLAVEGGKRNGRHTGICGQAPSDYPEFAEFLVGIGIDSISLNPDTVLKATRHILEIERRLGRS
ncbi:MAG: phosphoenolpyruvate synthase [Gammaproteobacteria bacterium]